MKQSYLKKYTLEQRVAMLEEEIAELKRRLEVREMNINYLMKNGQRESHNS